MFFCFFFFLYATHLPCCWPDRSRPFCAALPKTSPRFATVSSMLRQTS